jgi:thiol peroxidase
MDLPFAQTRFCGVQNTDKITALSDHRDASFGTNYGVLIKELRLLARAIFIVGVNDKIEYCEVVKEVTQHPDYEKALSALKAGKR